MSNDDGENERNRDARGRWMPGHCPNPKGRPKKKATEKYGDLSDIKLFGEKIVAIKAKGKNERIDRRGALVLKMFETAMNGNSHMQRFLFEQFKEKDEEIAEAIERGFEIVREWAAGEFDTDGSESELPGDIEFEMRGIQLVLRRYGLDIFPNIGWDDDEDERGGP